MAVTPYQLDFIHRITRKELVLSESLLRFFPPMMLKETLSVAIRKELMVHFGQEVTFFLESFQESANREILAGMPDVGVMAVMGAKPARGKVICEMDMAMATLVMDRLLGSGTDDRVEYRRPTETEQGVLQYALMRILQIIHTACGHESPLHFRFERFVFNADEALQALPEDETSVVLSFRLGVLDKTGFVRILIPQSVIQSVLMDPVIDYTSTRDVAFFLEELKRFGFVQTALWVEAGRTSLTMGDLGALEAGDVLLLDETGVTTNNGQKMTGRVTLRVGSGDHGGWQAQLNDAPRLSCRITGSG